MIDCFCKYCNRETPFKYSRISNKTFLQFCRRDLTAAMTISKAPIRLGYEPVGDSWDARLDLKCSRAGDHGHTYFISLEDQTLFKAGQNPSLEDVAGGGEKKYSRVLKGQYSKELRRAGGLASHGVGIGAFVYLRRIFEALLHQHYEVFAAQKRPIDGFTKLHISEKIDALRDVLPPLLVENKSIYSILSKGIHQLEEKECLEYFSTIRDGIVMILDQDLAILEKKEAEENFRKSLSKITSKIGKSEG